MLAVLAWPPGGTSSPKLILTRRVEGLAHHGGQLCLPGGRLEPGEAALDAALRETHEELGLARAAMTVVGPLTPVFVPVSGFLVHPFLAVAGWSPPLRADPAEVAEVIELPMEQVVGRKPEQRTELRGNVRVHIPYYPVRSHQLWGATAMIVTELADLLERGARDGSLRVRLPRR